MATPARIQGRFWQWGVGRAFVGKQGHYFLEMVSAWLPERGPGDPRLYCPELPIKSPDGCRFCSVGQQSFSRQQLKGLQRGRYSSRGCLWDRPWAWAHREALAGRTLPRVFESLSSCSVWCQAVSEGGGPAGGSWMRGTPHHILVDSMRSQLWSSSRSGRGR